MKTDNIIATKKLLIKACIETAKKLYGSQQRIQVLHLWVYEPTYNFLLAEEDDFKKELAGELKEHLVRPLMDASIEIHSGKPGFGVESGVLVADAVAYSYEYASGSTIKTGKTLIVKLNLLSSNNGSKTFVLNSSEKTDYRIGRVAAAYDSEGNFRENDIVIDDEHISRAQADLYFKDGKRFLRPTSTGYRPNGNPTRIHSKGKKAPIDLCDEYKGVQVTNGDIIEFGGRNGVLYKVEFE